jgi:hypothetical protein
MVGEQRTRQRTVFDDELLELLEIEPLLSTSSTHILCRDLIERKPSDNVSRCEPKRLTKSGGSMDTEIRVKNTKCLPISLCNVCALLLAR